MESGPNGHLVLGAQDAEVGPEGVLGRLGETPLGHWNDAPTPAPGKKNPSPPPEDQPPVKSNRTKYTLFGFVMSKNKIGTLLEVAREYNWGYII